MLVLLSLVDSASLENILLFDCSTAHLQGFVELSRGGQDKVQYS